MYATVGILHTILMSSTASTTASTTTTPLVCDIYAYIVSTASTIESHTLLRLFFLARAGSTPFVRSVPSSSSSHNIGKGRNIRITSAFA